MIGLQYTIFKKKIIKLLCKHTIYVYLKTYFTMKGTR